MADLSKGRFDFFKLGDWNASCSLCGRKRKASHLVKNWQGLYRCPEHNEPRQPQDFVRGQADIQTPPWVQDQIDGQVGPGKTSCTLSGQAAIPSLAIPYCFVPSRAAPPPDPIFGYCTSIESTCAIPSDGIPGCLVPGRFFSH